MVSDDGDSLQVEPKPDGGLLTPQSNTLDTATLDSDSGPVTDMEHFFQEFKNEDGEAMRRCQACL